MNHPATSQEQRGGISNRRRRPTRPWDALLSRGRRRSFRRAGESQNAYVDRPTWWAALWVLAIMALCALDALLTLIHLQHGGKELVPTMRYALDLGQGIFVNTKMVLTGLGVFFLALHANFALARWAIGFVFLSYALLTGYHLLLVSLR